MAPARFVPALLFMFAGLLVWAAHLLAVYVFTAIACARGLGRAQFLGLDAVPLFVLAATAAAALALLAILVAAFRMPSEGGDWPRFLRWIAGAGAGLSLVAVLWQGLPALLVSPCAH